MVRWRARDAGIKTKTGCHPLPSGADLRSTKLYDRTTNQVGLDEIERIAI